MKHTFFDFPHQSPLGSAVRAHFQGTEGEYVLRSFPDDESYLRILSPVKDRDIIITASLFKPNRHLLDLLFFCDAVRAQGARRIILIAPYLPYMRQDKEFQPGEALTSQSFANLLSDNVDHLITIDPHLHRYESLSEIYSIPTKIVHASPLIAEWIKHRVDDPFFIGPDRESEQWVKEVAQDLPYAILEKTRFGDTEVSIAWPDGLDIGSKTPVLVDDIISSGATMLEILTLLTERKYKAPFCITIHPLFTENAMEDLLDAGAAQVISCNTVSHLTNKIDLTSPLAACLEDILKSSSA